MKLVLGMAQLSLRLEISREISCKTELSHGVVARRCTPSLPPHRPDMPLYTNASIEREKNGITFAPHAKNADGCSPHGHLLFVEQARDVNYDQLADTCVADASLKTCAAVLVERFCFEKGFDKDMLHRHLHRLGEKTAFPAEAFIELCEREGYVDLTRIDEHSLHTLVMELPLWHQLTLHARGGL